MTRQQRQSLCAAMSRRRTIRRPGSLTGVSKDSGAFACGASYIAHTENQAELKGILARSEANGTKARLLNLYQPKELSGIVREAWEDRLHVALPEVLCHDLAEDAAIIGGDGKVAAVVKLAVFHSRPTRVHLAALNAAAHHEHTVCVAVICAAIAVLVGGASEFGHADENDVTHAVAHILMKCGDSLPEIAEQV